MTDHRYDLMTPRFPRLMEAHSWGYLRQGTRISCVVGVINGLAYLSLLPLSMVLSTGEPFLGLGLGPWLIVLACTAVVGSTVDFIGQKISYKGSLGALEDMHNAVGEKVSRLPLSGSTETPARACPAWSPRRCSRWARRSLTSCPGST